MKEGVSGIRLTESIWISTLNILNMGTLYTCQWEQYTKHTDRNIRYEMVRHLSESWNTFVKYAEIASLIVLFYLEILDNDLISAVVFNSA